MKMEKIKDIYSIQLINGNCLVEISGLSNIDTEGEEYVVQEKTAGGIIVGQEVAKYNKGTHAIRYGKIVRLPDKFQWHKERWITDSFPELNSEVWFDYLDAKDATMIEYVGRKHIILKYTSLYLARSPKGDIKPLNGYLVAKKHPVASNSPLAIKMEYYDDIYDIVYAGKPNVSYRVERNSFGTITNQEVDDKSIMEGMTVLTKISSYPVLEETLYWKFSPETFYVFQRKDVIGEVKEL